ncbi:MAG TPA: GMP synthase (glutamine-hydrolyzing), partial [Candidatus Omnitrophota bacterium]|nr:GMP synthase (glutamine-hydrolyzing) [Candidatus Omnitrophota bacterium]
MRKKEKKRKIVHTKAAVKPPVKREMVLVLDFGSQYTQLIARRARENHVYSQIVPYNISAQEISEIAPRGLILSGGPASVYEKKSPAP